MARTTFGHLFGFAGMTAVAVNDLMAYIVI